MTENQQKDIFNQWLNQYKSLIFKIVHSFAAEIEEKNDLFQEIAIQVWHSVPKFRAESATTTWVYRVALNTAIKWSTREKKHTDHRESLDQCANLLYEQPFEDDRITWLYDEISKLGEIDRSLALLLLDGFSYKEMSAISGITESNIGVKIHRIKKQLTSRSVKFSKHGI